MRDCILLDLTLPSRFLMNFKNKYDETEYLPDAFIYAILSIR